MRIQRTVFALVMVAVLVATAAVLFAVTNHTATVLSVSANGRSATTRQHAVAQPNQEVGLSVGNTLEYANDANRDAALDDIQSLGVTWLRFDVAWSDVQSDNSTTYDWTSVDNVVAAAQARGLHLLPILVYTPTWARLPSCANTAYCAPADPDQFAAFARTAAERYAPQGVHDWEIWNEPNMGRYWGSAGNIVGYATLLTHASTAIRAVDPSAVVVTGGLSPAATRGADISPTDFLEGLYDAGAGNSFDAVGDHPYSYPVPPSYAEDWNAWQQMDATPTSIRSVMAAHGDAAKQIWITEYGAPTNGPGTEATENNYQLDNAPDHVSEALQARMLSEALQAHAEDPWAGPLFWYSYKDLGITTDTNENFFGLIRFDGSKKPSYAILQQNFIQ